MQKKRAIANFNAPNGSRDTLFQSQEFEQDERRHFVGFQPKNESETSQESFV